MSADAKRNGVDASDRDSDDDVLPLMCCVTTDSTLVNELWTESQTFFDAPEKTHPGMPSLLMPVTVVL